MPCIAHKNTLRNKAVLPIRKGEPLLFFKNFKFAQKTEERKMLKIDHLTKTYGEKKAVDDLSLQNCSIVLCELKSKNIYFHIVITNYKLLLSYLL